MQREDGESIGYLEPVTADYAEVLPRNLLGHQLSGPVAYSEAEELLERLGIAPLTNPWLLDATDNPNGDEVTILELSPHGIVVANALKTKALLPTERLHIQWPDVDQRLSPASSAANAPL